MVVFAAQGSRPQLRGSPLRFHADPQLMLESVVRGELLSSPLRDNSLIDSTDPSLFLLFSIPYLYFQKWRQRSRGSSAFSPAKRLKKKKKKNIYFLIFFFSMCSFTLFHFSLPSSFHLINKHTLQPTFIEQLGSSVPSHFLTIHRVL